jgi:hypothetical protein
MDLKKYVSKIASKIPTGWINNKNITTVVALIIALYAGLAAPALPNSVIHFFDQWYGKLLFITVIAILASSNIEIALMVSVVFFVILHTASQLDIKERFEGQCGNETFENEKKEEKKDGEMKEEKKEEKKDGEMKEEKKEEGKNEQATAPEMTAVTDPAQLLQSTLDALQKSGASETAMAEAIAPVKESFQTQPSLSVQPYDGSEVGAPFFESA